MKTNPNVSLRRSGMGFTLVELLVVIAIIGALIALLLPAVQAAREAARRMSCTNNLKQLALSCHNYHDTHNSLPRGSWSAAKGVTSPSYGSNWRAAILPFIEQQSVFSQLDFSGTVSFSAWNNADGWAGTANAVLAGFLVPAYACPSCPVEQFDSITKDPLVAPYHRNELKSMFHTYVGIAGAYPTPDGSAQICFGGSTNQGYHSTRGAFTISGYNYGTAAQQLPFTGGDRPFSVILDGTSNTFLFGEQSGLVRYGTSGYIGLSSNYLGGWVGAARNGADVTTTNVVGVTTIRYAMNPTETITTTGTTWSGTAYCLHGLNTVLHSAHPGGVQFALVDGSVHFVSQTLPMDVLSALAVMDDGLSVSLR